MGTEDAMVRRSSFGSVHPKPSKAKPRYLEAQYLVPMGAWKKWPKQLTARNGKPKKRIYKNFKLTQEADAWNWIHAAEKAIDMGVWEPPELEETKAEADATTFREYADYYLGHHRKRNGDPIGPQTKDKYRQYLRDYLLPLFADKPMTAFTERDIQEWADSMPVGKAGEGQSIKRHVWELIHAMFLEACTKPWQNTGAPLLDRSPVVIRVDRPDKDIANGSATPEEIQAIADHMPARMSLIVYLCGVMCMRPGEAYALQRQDVVLPDTGTGYGVIHITKSAKPIMRDGHKIMFVGSTKTKGSVRDMDIPPFMVPMIRAHLDRFVDDTPDAWLFTGERTRELIRDQSVRNAFYRARAYVPRLDACKFRLYDLRHTGLTTVGHSTNSLIEVMRAGGHTQAKTAMHYQHSTDEGRREITEKIQAEWDTSQDHAGQAATPDTPHDTPTREPATDASGSPTGGDNVATLAHALAGMPVADRAAMLDGVDAGTVTRVLAAMPPAQRLETIMVLHGGKENRE